MEQLEPIELQEFVRATIKQIESGAEQRWIEGSVKFEVLVTQTKRKDGGLKIYVASGQVGQTTELVQKVSFNILSKPPKTRPGTSGLTEPAY